MFEIGERVLDKELNVIVTIEDKEWQNGWYYFCSMDNGAVGYRYENELDKIQGGR